MPEAPIKRLQLLSEAGANVTGEWKEWSGNGVGTIAVYGTFSGQTVTIEGSTDGGKTAVAYTTSYTSATIAAFEAGRILVRAKVSNGGAPSVNVDLVPPERSG